MANFPDINALTLGNTFGAWYAKTNDIITRLNTLEVSNIVSGDGVTVRGFTSGSIPYGGYTLDIGDTVSKNVTFNGNVTINGVLSSSYGVDVSGINVVLPANTGVTIGNIVYVDSTGKIEKALANDECTSEVVGVVVGFTGGNAQVATTGKISGSSVVANFLGTVGATLQKGVVYFLSGGVSGAGTTLEPDVTSYVSKPMLLGLTGDTGLILPYRGYIGLTAAGSSVVVSGVCGGVTSLNKSTSKFFANSSDYNNNIWKTSGDLLGLQTIYAGASLITRDVQIDATIQNIRGNGLSVTDPLDSTAANSTYLKTTISDDYVTYEQIIPLFSPQRTYNLYATSGITGDVWKLKNIKIHVKDAPDRSFSYGLIRTIHRFGGTNYIIFNGYDDGAQEGPASSALIFGMSEVNLIVTPQTSVSGTATAITGKTLLSPRIHAPWSTSIGTSRPNGDGYTAGILLPNSVNPNNTVLSPNVGAYAEQNAAGRYPIIYSYNDSATTPFNPYAPVFNRTYAWDFTGVTFGGTSEPIVSECIKNSVEGTDINLSSPSGVTMDSSILGWNANYGAVSESLDLIVFDYPTTGSPGGTLLSSSGATMRCVVYLELCKYDINTKTEGATVIINVPIERGRFINLSMFGYNVTNKLY